MSFRATNPTQLGKILTGYRKQRGLTQEQLGIKAGLSQSAISALETDPGTISVRKLYRVLSALELDLFLTNRDTASADSRGEDEW